MATALSYGSSTYGLGLDDGEAAGAVRLGVGRGLSLAYGSLPGLGLSEDDPVRRRVARPFLGSSVGRHQICESAIAFALPTYSFHTDTGVSIALL